MQVKRSGNNYNFNKIKIKFQKSPFLYMLEEGGKIHSMHALGPLAGVDLDLN
jgi:hypothetical protein